MSDKFIDDFYTVQAKIVKEPMISERKDGTGKVVNLRAVKNIPYTDKYGEPQVAAKFFDITVFDRESADAISQAGLKVGDYVQVGGAPEYRERDYQGDEGEDKTYHGMRVVVADDKPEHFARVAPVK